MRKTLGKTAKRLIAAAVSILLVTGGAAGWYFGVYTKDFKVTSGEVFSEVYEGDFMPASPMTTIFPTASPRQVSIPWISATAALCLTVRT